MKYEFIKIDDDITQLKYKDKVIEIKKTVDLIRKMQSIPALAKTKMMIDLTKQGISSKDLVIVKKEGNKTFYDNSNLQEIEKAYNDQASIDLVNDICKEKCGLDLIELIQELDLDENETEKFSQELIGSLIGLEKDKFPSKDEN